MANSKLQVSMQNIEKVLLELVHKIDEDRKDMGIMKIQLDALSDVIKNDYKATATAKLTFKGPTSVHSMRSFQNPLKRPHQD